jgi:hypothetical protein
MGHVSLPLLLWSSHIVTTSDTAQSPMAGHRKPGWQTDIAAFSLAKQGLLEPLLGQGWKSLLVQR